MLNLYHVRLLIYSLYPSVYVTKRGEEDDCGYYYPFSTWGCTSTGNAYSSQYEDDYYTESGAQELNIVDATNSRYTFHMTHYYDERTNRSDDHEISELDILVNGVSIGKFKRPNADFDGTIKINMDCDNDCNCVAV